MSGNKMRWPAAAVAGGLVVLAALIGCGKKESVASKSAAAFQEARKRGETFEGEGHSHGGHVAMAPGGGPSEPMQHEAATGEEHHAGHAAAGGGSPADHSAMGHGAGQHAGHGSPAGDRPAAAGHDHGAMQPDAPGQSHAGHSASGGGTPSAPMAEIPTRPADILQPDPLDAPASTSVVDAQRSAEMNQAMSGGHGADTYRHADAGREESAPGEEAGIYVCPMHPEVTSNAPGTCPKCGMTLVERRKE